MIKKSLKDGIIKLPRFKSHINRKSCITRSQDRARGNPWFCNFKAVPIILLVYNCILFGGLLVASIEGFIKENLAFWRSHVLQYAFEEPAK